MFWEKWIPAKYLVKATVCGLEILVTDGGFKFFYTIITIKNNKIRIVETGAGENKLELPPVITKDKIPLVLAIVGRGLISKKVSFPDGEMNYDELLMQNLPAIDRNDFDIQFYPQQGCDAFINIFRKDKVNSILELIKQTKNEIANVYLGYSFISEVTPLTSLFDRILTNDATIEITNSCIESVKTGVTEENSTLNIDDVSLNKFNVLGFALCFVYLLNSNRQHNYSNLNDLLKCHIEKNKLRILKRAAIVTAFTLCLINYLCFNYYFTENKKLETELNLYEGKYQQINELLNSYEEKKSLIEEAGILNNEGFSKNIDKIASTIPKELVLTDWNISPIIQNNDEDSLMRFRKNNLFIKGNCDKSLLVNEWIHVLKSQNFIKDVNLENFAFRNEGDQPNFELKIVTE
jgi:hypothetical protein